MSLMENMGFGRACFLKFMGVFSVLKATSLSQDKCCPWYPVQAWTLVWQNRRPVKAHCSSFSLLLIKTEGHECGREGGTQLGK